MLTQERLKEVVKYHPETGIFEWVKFGTGKIKGKKVGFFDGEYQKIGIDGKQYRCHRIAWLYMHGVLPECLIDHIDGNKFNNAISNLRLATRSENQKNRKLQKNVSGFKGVHLHKQTGKWRAVANVNKKKYSLGLFETALLASEAYNDFAKKTHGEFYLDTRSSLAILDVHARVESGAIS